MTVCECCGELAMNTLGPYCDDCINDIKEYEDDEDEV